MTWLLTGSLVSLFTAALTLGFGWLGANGTLVWVSIGCSIATALLLAIAYTRSKYEAALAARRARGSTRPVAEPSGYASPSVQRRQPARRKRTPQASDDVVAVPARRRYHRPECRYAQVRGAVRVSRSTARRRRYEPCGICRP